MSQSCRSCISTQSPATIYLTDTGSQADLDHAAHHWQASIDPEAVHVPALGNKAAYRVARNGISIESL